MCGKTIRERRKILEPLGWSEYLYGPNCCNLISKHHHMTPSSITEQLQISIPKKLAPRKLKSHCYPGLITKENLPNVDQILKRIFYWSSVITESVCRGSSFCIWAGSKGTTIHSGKPKALNFHCSGEHLGKAMLWDLMFKNYCSDY